jgi:hypothetical protein
MTNAPNDERIRRDCDIRFDNSAFIIPSLIRHSGFVIRHSRIPHPAAAQRTSNVRESRLIPRTPLVDNCDSGRFAPPSRMTYLNPLIAPIVQGPQAQRAAAADKERQIARTQALSKNSAAEGDRFERQVESAEGLSPVGDDPAKGGQHQSQRRPSNPKARLQDDAGKAHIDVTG